MQNKTKQVKTPSKQPTEEQKITIQSCPHESPTARSIHRNAINISFIEDKTFRSRLTMSVIGTAQLQKIFCTVSSERSQHCLETFWRENKKKIKEGREIHDNGVSRGETLRNSRSTVIGRRREAKKQAQPWKTVAVSLPRLSAATIRLT